MRTYGSVKGLVYRTGQPLPKDADKGRKSLKEQWLEQESMKRNRNDGAAEIGNSGGSLSIDDLPELIG